MSSSYSGDPATSDKDAVRFLIQDTGVSGGFDITDEEIVWLLDTEGSIYLAAAFCCDKLTTIKSGGGLASKKVGGLSESYSTGSLQFYANQAKLYRKRGSGLGVPWTADQPQVFGMGQFDHPGTSDPLPADQKIFDVEKL
jgi:hypothetical protein